MTTESGSEQKPARLTSLDQFRGYTMLGMLLVNFIGGYAVCPKILKHSHDYCSYADTIMPQFLFAAGFAMRLSLGRRLETTGQMPWGRAVRRILGLAAVAIFWYSFGDWGTIVERLRTENFFSVIGPLCKRDWFQTLMHIAATSLWILPVIAMSGRRRFLFAAASGLLHMALSWWFNIEWVNTAPNGIDGGPLGFLTWATPAIFGTLACDLVKAQRVAATGKLIVWGVLVMIVGWAMSIPSTMYNVPPDEVESLKDIKIAADPVIPGADRLRNWDRTLIEPPFVPPPDKDHRKWNYWMMSQRCGNWSYPMFAAGLSLVIFAGFLWVCDGKGLQLGLFRTLGTNSLAAYILHGVAGWYISPHFDKSSCTAFQASVGFFCFANAVYAICRILEWRKWYLRV